MNIKRLISALEKAGLEVIRHDRNDYRKGMLNYEPFYHYTCHSATHKCDWYPNGRNNDGSPSETCCAVQVMRRHESNDIQSDYFAGSFCRTIKSVVAAMKGN